MAKHGNYPREIYVTAAFNLRKAEIFFFTIDDQELVEAVMKERGEDMKDICVFPLVNFQHLYERGGKIYFEIYRA
jgi:hypothetical protein